MARVVKQQRKTRYCACPNEVVRDCRFHSNSRCPYDHFPGGRWLWAEQFVDIETGEIVDPTSDDEIVIVSSITQESDTDSTAAATAAATAPAPAPQRT